MGIVLLPQTEGWWRRQHGRRSGTLEGAHVAKPKIIYQAVTKHSHAEMVRSLLKTKGIKRFMAGVAYVTEDGVRQVAEELASVGKQATLWVGIRNEVTTLQGIVALLHANVRVFAVDTAKRRRIFHPKLFVATGDEAAQVLVGSANLTFGGLLYNIEASALLSLNLDDQDDHAFWESTVSMLDSLAKQFPDNVFRIKNQAHAVRLQKEGRLLDESIEVERAPRARKKDGSGDTLKPMQLHSADASAKSPKVRKRKPAKQRKDVGGQHQDYELVWQSKPLTRRDLNIPSGANTAKTGSMLWKKGVLEGIDQRHHFRDVIFAGLNWQRDPNEKRSHYERTAALFRIVVKGVDRGVFELRLSHNTNTSSKTYEQKNSMTQVHWGEATPLVAIADLLGRTMYLYRLDAKRPLFMIEID
jgi:HKD family nuclease